MPFELLKRQHPGPLSPAHHRRRRPAREHLQNLQAATGAVTLAPLLRRYRTSSRRYYRAADLFVHPGVQETFGLVALESQACGTPVVGIAGSYMDRIIFNAQQRLGARELARALAQAIHEAQPTQI